MNIVALEKVSLVIRKILRLFVNTLTADEKDYVLNRDNLTQPIHMQLSDKEKTFSQFIFLFLKTILNFKSFSKRDDRHRQTTYQMSPNTVGISTKVPLIYLLITVKAIALEKVSFSDTQNPKTVC